MILSIMSFTNPAGDLSQFSEVVPEAARVQGLTRSSILTQRRRVRIPPQTGPTAGLAGTGGGNTQMQFLIADQGGLVDPRSICLNYTILVTGATTVPDEGHVFQNVQVLLNGQPLDNIQNAMKLTNIEMTMGASKSYYQTAASFQGFELLNNDLLTATADAAAGYGYVTQNVADIAARTTRAAAAVYGNVAGETRSVPLGILSGVGRMKSYIPIALLGEIALVLQTGSAGECLFNTSSNVAGDFSLSQVSLEYDVVIPRPEYMMLLQKVANDPNDVGLNLPYESSIVQAGGVITGSTTAPLSEQNIIVSRATNHLLRSSVVQVPSAALQSVNYPSQSAFSHAGVWQAQWRIGSQYYPNLPAQGDAAIFNCAMEAYGSVAQENGTCTNRVLWGNSTNPTAGTPAVFETASLATGGTVRYAYADRCIPSYGFRTVKGGADALDIDGVSLAGASGSQCIVTLVSAPQTNYIPFVSLVALRFIQAQAGGVRVAGA